MNKKRFQYSWFGAIAGLMILFSPVSAQPEQPGPVITAVLFYSPDCPHCHQVLEEVLIPLTFQYSDSLRIMGINTAAEPGSRVFQNFIDYFEISSFRQGVPALIIGDTVLVGDEIGRRIHSVTEQTFADGGAHLPPIPGLLPDDDSSMKKLELKPLEEVRNEFVNIQPEESAPQDELNSEEKVVGWSVTAVLLFSSGFFLVRLSKYGFQPFPGVFKPKIPGVLFFLALAGLGISLYLSYTEIRQVDALCGPIGDCNAVQDSSFSQVAGVPVAVLGAVYYAGMIILKLIFNAGSGIFIRTAAFGLLFMAFTGVLYSLFLTYLELRVINAVCAWCLGSAVITAVMLIILSCTLIRKPA